jgi:predicted pyridoxine 5'-phosphate oxidase superfamily flavin-nucleotide-binding protein
MEKMNDEVKGMLDKMPFIPIASMGDSGPHLIVVGKGIVIDDETVAFFGWRQGVTSKNIENNGVIQIVVVSEEKNKGYRLAGKGRIEKEGAIPDRLREIFPKQLGKLNFVTVMKVERIEPLL